MAPHTSKPFGLVAEQQRRAEQQKRHVRWADREDDDEDADLSQTLQESKRDADAAAGGPRSESAASSRGEILAPPADASANAGRPKSPSAIAAATEHEGESPALSTEPSALPIAKAG